MCVKSLVSTKSHVERLPETLLKLDLMGKVRNPCYMGSEVGELHIQDQSELVNGFRASVGT